MSGSKVTDSTLHGEGLCNALKIRDPGSGTASQILQVDQGVLEREEPAPAAVSLTTM